jgi:hypothetical protein
MYNFYKLRQQICENIEKVMTENGRLFLVINCCQYSFLFKKMLRPAWHKEHLWNFCILHGGNISNLKNFMLIAMILFSLKFGGNADYLQ